MANIRLHQCIVERIMLRKYGRFDTESDAVIFDREAIVIEACGTPLFTDQEMNRGVCRACASGWQVEGNRPTADGLSMIELTKQTKV